MNRDMQHASVMRNEILSTIAPQPNKTYVDATFGGGGHCISILDASPLSNVIAFDCDDYAAQCAETVAQKYGHRFKFFKQNFNRMLEFVDCKVDGVYADLGMSNMQLNSDRGFSFSRHSALDMRMDGNCNFDAKYIVNTYDYHELVQMFKCNADDYRYSKRLANAIVKHRDDSSIETTTDLLSVIKPINKDPGYSAKVFQAIRIEVNREKSNLSEFLVASLGILNTNCPIAVISFHSIEDNIVKDFFTKNSSQGINRYETSPVMDKLLHFKKPSIIKPTEEEILQNRMSRSAIMRVAYMNGVPTQLSSPV